jgi:hypothetical protein
MKGYISGVEMIRIFQQELSLPMLPGATRSNHYCGDGVINNIVVEIFADSAENEEGRMDHYSETISGLLLTLHTVTPDNLQVYIDSIPHIGVVIAIKESSEAIIARA